MNELEYEEERKRMVVEQLSSRGIRDPRLLAAMQAVPRHRFVTEENLPWAYADGPLPIGHGQTISQPYIVALMTEALHLTGDECVLEIGTGSGYQAAILSQLVKQVHTVEIISELAERAEKVFRELGYRNLLVHVGDGGLGWSKAAPYDGILVSAAAPRAPKPLLNQLNDGGRMILPVGSFGFQELEIWERRGPKFHRESSIAVAFVPLRGEHGWRSRDW